MPRAASRPWWQAHTGAWVALSIALASGWYASVRQDAWIEERARVMPDRRDRELDSLERRVAAMERARCE